MPTGWLTILAAWSFLPLLVPMVLWNHPAVVAAALGVGLFLNPAGNAGVGSYRIAVTPDALQGRIQSTMQFVSMSAMPLSPVVAGALLSGLGGAGAVAVLGVLTALVALIPTAEPQRAGDPPAPGVGHRRGPGGGPPVDPSERRRAGTKWWRQEPHRVHFVPEYPGAAGSVPGSEGDGRVGPGQREPGRSGAGAASPGALTARCPPGTACRRGRWRWCG